MVSANIKINGRVQGVFFRASTQKKARELGICGFVRNEKDGSVYIEAEGEKEAMERFILWCHEGPPGAKVNKVKAINNSPRGFKNFEIQRHLF
jgi:acylphosphatase